MRFQTLKYERNLLCEYQQRLPTQYKNNSDFGTKFKDSAFQKV
jgi:hypothetical protein